LKEIGGYFGLEKLVSHGYYKDLIALNSCRNAILYILKAKKYKKLYIPYYLCNAVSNMLKKNNIDFDYYHIDNNFKPVFKKKINSQECILIVNYYGQTTNDNIYDLKKKYHRIIIDNTQAFFQRPLGGVDTIYSCRKYFGVPDGAYLSTEVKIENDLGVDISKDRTKHILGRYEGLASEYYNDFQNNEKYFKVQPLKYMSKLTQNILGAIDYDNVCMIRNENYFYLHNKLCNENKLELVFQEGPFAYPFCIGNGVEIRKELMKKRIYIPTLWPSVLTDALEYSIEYNYATNILPLPCDQRYTVEDMKYMIEQLLNLVRIEN